MIIYDLAVTGMQFLKTEIQLVKNLISDQHII